MLGVKGNMVFKSDVTQKVTFWDSHKIINKSGNGNNVSFVKTKMS